MRPRNGGRSLSKRLLLERIEEQAVEIYRLRQEQKTEREAARRGLEAERRLVHDLREEINRLSTPKSPDKDLGARYDEVRRALVDIESLCERDNLTDADKWRSIRGITHQITGQSWFEPPRDTPAAGPKTRRGSKKDAGAAPLPAHYLAAVERERAHEADGVSAAGNPTLPNADTPPL
jgi:hypothetical protein